MASPSTINGDQVFTGAVTFTNTLSTSSAQYLNSTAAAIYPIHMELLREATAYATVLPGTSSSTFLGLVGGTIGSQTPRVTTGDIRNTSGTRSARVQFCLPPEYTAGGAVTLRMSAGMETTVTNSSCVLDAQVYKSARTDGAPGSDICATAAQSIDSTTFADKSFTITPTSLVPGDWLDIKIDITWVDTSGAGVIDPTIGAIEILLAIRG